jgi:hypothetical protein
MFSTPKDKQMNSNQIKLKTMPIIFKYKMINFQFNEKEEGLVAEVSTGVYPIQSQYNPCHIKGHTLTIKVDYLIGDKNNFKEPGLNLLFNLNSSLNLYVAIVEEETGIVIEIHSGMYPIFIDVKNKIMTPPINNILLSQQTQSIITHNNCLTAKILTNISNISSN